MTTACPSLMIKRPSIANSAYTKPLKDYFWIIDFWELFIIIIWWKYISPCVSLSLVSINECGRVKAQHRTFSVFSLGGSDLSSPCPGRSNPMQLVTGTHRIEGWVCPRTCLDALHLLTIPPWFLSRLFLNPLNTRIKSHLLFAGIIRSTSFSPR